MIVIKFEGLTRKLPLVKAIRETIDCSIKAAKDAVDSGEVRCHSQSDADMIKVEIVKSGGTVTDVQYFKDTPAPSVEDVVTPAQNETFPELFERLLREAKKNPFVNEVEVSVNVAKELVILSKISVSNRLYHKLVVICADELKNVSKHIRLVCGLTQVPAENDKPAMSILALRIPEKYVVIDDIVELSDAARAIHEIILEAASKESKFDAIEKDLKQFYDE